MKVCRFRRRRVRPLAIAALALTASVRLVAAEHDKKPHPKFDRATADLAADAGNVRKPASASTC